MSGTYILGYMLKIDVNHVGTFKSPGLLPGEANIWNVADAKLLIMLNYWLNELSVLTVVEVVDESVCKLLPSQTISYNHVK